MGKDIIILSADTPIDKEITYNRRRGMFRKCGWCSKIIFKPMSEVRDNNFCSITCLNKWQGRNKIELTCKTCGRIFRRSPSWTTQKVIRFWESDVKKRRNQVRDSIRETIQQLT